MQRDDIATAIFGRLQFICPSCQYAPWGSFLDSSSVSIACSGVVRNEVVFRARLLEEMGGVRGCRNNVRSCSLNAHLEFFHSLPNPHLLVSDSLYLLDRNCPLYASSSQSADCLTPSPSVGATAGAAVGGLIAGAALTAGIVVVILVILYVRRRRKRDEIEYTPHPKTLDNPKKAHLGTNEYSTKGQGDDEIEVDDGHYDNDPSYEFLPTFKDQTMEEKAVDAEYDIPQDVLHGLPSSHNRQPSVEYEYPEAAGIGAPRNTFQMKTKKKSVSLKPALKKKEKAKAPATKKKGKFSRGEGDGAKTVGSSTVPLQHQQVEGVAPGLDGDHQLRSSNVLPIAAAAAIPPPPPAPPTDQQQEAAPPTKTVTPQQSGSKLPLVPKTAKQPPTAGKAPTAGKNPLQPTAKNTKAKIPEPPPPPEEDEDQVREGEGLGFKAMRKKMANLSGATVLAEGKQGAGVRPQADGSKKM